LGKEIIISWKNPQVNSQYLCLKINLNLLNQVFD